MSEPTPEQPDRPKRTDFVRAFSSSVRGGKEKRSLPGLIITGGLVVVLAGALAVGIGALVLHKKPPNTVSAADSHRSGKNPASGASTPSTSPRRIPAPGAPVAVPPGSAHDPAKAGHHGKSDGGKGGGASSGTTGSGTSSDGGAQVRAATVPTHSIVSNASGRCIDISGGGSSGAAIQIWSCTSASWQRWAFVSGTFRSGNLCMTASSSSNGTAVYASSCSGGSAQLFRLTDAGDIVHSGTSACVDVQDKNTANGTRLQLWKCAGTSNQKWHLA